MVKISWFNHIPGKHCGSTALMNVLNNQGFDFSEAFYFGLGAGIDFIYLKNLPYDIKEMIHVRGDSMEENCLNALKIPNFEKFREKSTQVALKNIKKEIEDGYPVIIQCDVKPLRYYKSKYHFPGHKLVLAGFDDKEKKYFVSDTAFKDLLKVPYDEIKEAFSYKDNTLFGQSNVWFRVRVDGYKPDEETLRIGIYRAIKMAAHNLLNYREYKYKKIKFYHGLMAIRKFLKDVATWKDRFKNWDEHFIFQYQVFEKRGTGGSAFRKMWMEFIDEADSFFPGLKALSERYRNFLIDRWKKLALSFKKVGEGDLSFLPKLEKLMQDIADREEDYMKRLLVFVDEKI